MLHLCTWLGNDLPLTRIKKKDPIDKIAELMKITLRNFFWHYLSQKINPPSFNQTGAAVDMTRGRKQIHKPKELATQQL